MTGDVTEHVYRVCSYVSHGGGVTEGVYRGMWVKCDYTGGITVGVVSLRVCIRVCG